MSMVGAIVNTPFPRDFSAPRYLHFLSNGEIQLHLAMAGNYPRISGITPSLGLVHYPLLPVTHRYTLLVQSSRSAPPPRRTVAERRATCPSSDGSTNGQDGFCFEDRRGCNCRGRPHEKVPLPASPKAPPHQQRCGVTIDGPMRSLLSLTRFAFRPRKHRAIRR